MARLQFFDVLHLALLSGIIHQSWWVNTSFNSVLFFRETSAVLVAFVLTGATHMGWVYLWLSLYAVPQKCNQFGIRHQLPALDSSYFASKGEGLCFYSALSKNTNVSWVCSTYWWPEWENCDPTKSRKTRSVLHMCQHWQRVSLCATKSWQATPRRPIDWCGWDLVCGQGIERSEPPPPPCQVRSCQQRGPESVLLVQLM